MEKTLISSTAIFDLEVPYELIETGAKGEKPLIIYLHGFKHNLEYFKKKCEGLLSVEAYHLFLQGPYVVYDENHDRKVAQWGRAWYLYDGEQTQFINSMEKSTQFIKKITDKTLAKIQPSKITLLGYSMGGYLAGYFGLSRPDYIDDLIVVGGRIKSEHFTEESYPNLSVLALHGTKDRSVDAQRQKESSSELKKMGAIVSYRGIDTGHRFGKPYIDEIKKWLSKNEYALIK
jgi:predicted esterase